LQLTRILQSLEQIAPTRLAELWDNVGLLAGDPEQEVSKALLTIDYTRAVAKERTSLGCELVIAYHPPIFQAIKRLAAGSVVFDAIRDGVAIFSPHTALDMAEGGTNDVLCDVLGVSQRSALKLAETKATQYKLVTFVPESALDKVSQALFDAGAGQIGKYSQYSFRSPGIGTFFGELGTNPTVGKAGQLENAPEIRIETVVLISRISAVIEGLRKSHPYEEPAFDLNQLAAPPEGVGIGRVAEFSPPVDRPELFDRIKRGLEIEHLLIAGPVEGKVSRVAVCAGACGDLLNDALAQKVDLYLTGEMRHHDALKAAGAGMTVVCTLHSNSERATLKRLKQRLEKELPELGCHLSQLDRDPFLVR
jgi:dinuclear metal center YbgI/SA1388 family protein